MKALFDGILSKCKSLPTNKTLRVTPKSKIMNDTFPQNGETM